MTTYFISCNFFITSKPRTTKKIPKNLQILVTNDYYYYRYIRNMTFLKDWFSRKNTDVNKTKTADGVITNDKKCDVS